MPTTENKPKQTKLPLIWDGQKYPTYTYTLDGKKMIGTSPYIANGDTVITAKPVLAPFQNYEVVVATPEGRYVETLDGTRLGTPSPNIWNKLLKIWGITPASKANGGNLNYFNLF